MNMHVDKTQKDKKQSVTNELSHKQGGGESTFQFVVRLGGSGATMATPHSPMSPHEEVSKTPSSASHNLFAFPSKRRSQIQIPFHSSSEPSPTPVSAS